MIELGHTLSIKYKINDMIVYFHFHFPQFSYEKHIAFQWGKETNMEDQF